MKLKARSLQLLVLFAVMSLVVLTPAQQGDAIWIEYLGRETKDSWIPVFALYDPPGNESYAFLTKSRTTSVHLEFGGGGLGNYATGGFDASLAHTEGWGTPDDEQMSCVICYEYRLTWDVYCYITPRRVFYKAILVDSEALDGKGIKRFDNLENFEVWADDRTGIAGDYSYHRLVDHGCSGYDLLEYEWTNLYYTSLGFEISLKGVAFSAGVHIESETTTKLEVKYYYKDTSEDLDFYLYSDYDIDFELQDPDYVDEVYIWFSE